MTKQDLKKITDLNRSIFEREEKLKELNKMLKRTEEHGDTGISSIQIISYDRIYNLLQESDIDKEIINFIDNSLLEYRKIYETELNELKKQFENIQIKMLNIEGEPHE